MALSSKKIAPAAPRLDSGRSVEIPYTTGAVQTSKGDELGKSKIRADWSEGEFVRVIRQHGKYVVWRKALLCPCFNPETEQAVLDCDACGGDGYIYVQPQQIQALMMQFDKKTSIYEKFGLYQEGSVNVTLEPQYRLGYRDSLEMRDAMIPMNELLIKGNRRGRRQVLPDGVDSARFRILDIAALVYRNSDGTMAFLEKDIHFQVTKEGWIKWLPHGNRVVPDKAVVSVHYDYHPIYMIMSWMHVTRDDVSGRKGGGTDRVIAHPVQAMAKLDFLTNSNGVPSMDPIVSVPSGFGPEGLPLG